jgi:ABC-type antimicrobial peptide transport system permease subunit
VFDLASMDDVIARSVGTRRFGTVVLVTFAAVALVLAVVGIYGVLSYVVAQRTREIGIRAALGASPRDVTRLVLRDGGRLVGLGLLVGALAFVVFGRVLASQVYGVGPRDLLTIVSGGALLAAVALIACWLPARRAAQVDPASALRGDEHW